MSSNTFGKEFCVTTFGESHGAAVGCILDGCPAGLKIDEAVIQKELDKRRPGQSDITTSRGEKDKVEILSGIFEGQTIGTPIGMLVKNKDADSSSYKKFINKPRPSHADFTWQEKFHVRDWRGGGRSSARETIGRVATGAIAKKLLLETLGTELVTYTKAIGGIEATPMKITAGNYEEYEDIIYSNSIRALDIERSKEMEEEIRFVKKEGDSVGGIVECIALNVPAGLGEPVFDKINADLAKAVCSIPAVKGVEFGLGFEMANQKGSQTNDSFTVKKGKVVTETNRAGGVVGGITNGMPLVLRVVLKPTASISKEQKTIDLKTKKETKIKIEGRHDPCIVPRAVPIVESMVALVLADHGLRSGLIPRSLV